MNESNGAGSPTSNSGRSVRCLTACAVLLLIGWVCWSILDEDAEPGNGDAAVGLPPRVETGTALPALGSSTELEPLLRETTANARQLHLRVWFAESGERLPVAGAAASCGAGYVLGRTDSLGTMTILDASARCDQALVVTAAGFVEALISHEAIEQAVSAADPLDVRLFPADRIAGRLSWPDGTEALLEGVTVLCWERGWSPDVNAISESLQPESHGTVDGLGSEASPLQVTLTDVDGSFEFPYPVPRGSYVITAGAPGVVSPASLDVDSRRAQGSVVRVWAHHAASVALLSPDGSTIGAGGASCEPNPIIRLPDTIPAGVDFFRAGPVQATLLGLESRPERDRGETILCELVAPWPSDAIGPLVLFARSPGYEEARVEILVPSTETGVGIVDVPMQPDGVELGSILLAVHGTDAVGAPKRSTSPHRLLLFDDVETVARRCHVLELESAGVELGNVPCGTYSRAELALGSGLATLRAEQRDPVIVRSREATTLTFDTSSLGRLEFALIGADGRPFLGPAQFVVESLDRVAQGWFTFDSGPYVAPGVQPGEYSVTLVFARDAGVMLGARDAPRVTISDGAVGRVRLELTEP